MYIVQGKKMHAECLFGYEQVADVGAGEARTGGAVAAGIEGERVGPELYVAHVEAPLARERGARASHARGRHAVEEIDAAPRPLDQVLREADAHEIARAVRRKRVAHHVEHLVHRRLGPVSYTHLTLPTN